MPLFETKSETPTNYKKAIQEGKNKISVLTEYFVEFLDEFNDSYYGDEESEDEYGRGRQVIKKTPNKTKQVNKYVVKGYVYDGGEIWKETFDNIDEAYELAYQIQNGWTDDGTYRLITIYDEKGKKIVFDKLCKIVSAICDFIIDFNLFFFPIYTHFVLAL